MFNFFIIMDEIQGNNIARNFSSEYFNYTINFIISKEFPALTDFPDFSLILCDLDKNIELAKKHNLPVIAFSHKNNRQESLMGTPWLILDTDGLSPFFLNEVYCRHYKKPLTITTQTAASSENSPPGNSLNFCNCKKKIKTTLPAASFHKTVPHTQKPKNFFKII